MPGPPCSRRAPRRGDRGAAAVEFALVAPLLLLVLFGTIQYSFYFWALQGGSDITRTAVRFASVSNPASCAHFEDAVGAQIDGFAAARGNADIARTYTKGTGNTASGVEVGDLVSVAVEFDSIDLGLSGLVPFIEDGRVTQAAQARVDYVADAPGNCS